MKILNDEQMLEWLKCEELAKGMIKGGFFTNDVTAEKATEIYEFDLQ